MHAVDRPIVEPGDAQRAAIAHAAAQNLPGVRQVVAILPHDLGHVAKVLRFSAAQAERDFRAKAAFVFHAVTAHACKSSFERAAKSSGVFMFRKSAASDNPICFTRASPSETHRAANPCNE